MIERTGGNPHQSRRPTLRHSSSWIAFLPFCVASPVLTFVAARANGLLLDTLKLMTTLCSACMTSVSLLVRRDGGIGVGLKHQVSQDTLRMTT
jgi:hypothetical protein